MAPTPLSHFLTTAPRWSNAQPPASSRSMAADCPRVESIGARELSSPPKRCWSRMTISGSLFPVDVRSKPHWRVAIPQRTSRCSASSRTDFPPQRPPTRRYAPATSSSRSEITTALRSPRSASSLSLAEHGTACAAAPSTASFVWISCSVQRPREALLVDVGGGVIGMTVLGPRRRALAIPRSTIDRVVDQLLAKGHVFRGYLGAGLQPLKHERSSGGSQALHPQGVLVVSIDPDGPSARAGMHVGDIVATWDGKPIDRVREVMRLLGPESVGSTVDLGLIRAGSPAALKIVVGERPVA